MDPDMLVQVSVLSLLFLPALHLRRSLEALAQAILDIRTPLLLQIMVSYFLVVDPSVKRTVTMLISQRDQVVR